MGTTPFFDGTMNLKDIDRGMGELGPDAHVLPPDRHHMVLDFTQASPTRDLPWHITQ